MNMKWNVMAVDGHWVEREGSDGLSIDDILEELGKAPLSWFNGEFHPMVDLQSVVAVSEDEFLINAIGTYGIAVWHFKRMVNDKVLR